ncbi:MAG TPA: hypothetical protein VF622_17835 [Segetibacter sp.]|jgi:uncharacterized membrane protein
MKYSSHFGVIAAITIIAACFLPWAYIASIQTTLTGWQTPNTTLGKPGLLNIIFASLSIILFIVPAVWAKRLNVFLAAINFAWTVRNSILLSQCEYGECPEQKIGLIIIVISSALLFLMTLFPRVRSKEPMN